MKFKKKTEFRENIFKEAKYRDSERDHFFMPKKIKQKIFYKQKQQINNPKNLVTKARFF